MKLKVPNTDLNALEIALIFYKLFTLFILVKSYEDFKLYPKLKIHFFLFMIPIFLKSCNFVSIFTFAKHIFKVHRYLIIFQI